MRQMILPSSDYCDCYVRCPMVDGDPPPPHHRVPPLACVLGGPGSLSLGPVKKDGNAQIENDLIIANNSFILNLHCRVHSLHYVDWYAVDLPYYRTPIIAISTCYRMQIYNKPHVKLPLSQPVKYIYFKYFEIYVEE